MSFSYNPFEHLDIVKGESGMWYAHCHGCGADMLPHVKETPLVHFLMEMANHLIQSHKRNPSDFEDWSNH